MDFENTSRIRIVTQSLLVLLLMLAGSCSDDGTPSVEAQARADEIPKPDSWDGVELLVQRQIEAAYQHLIDADDSTLAQGRAWVDIARSYHANDLIDLAGPCYAKAEELEALDATSWYDFARLKSELGDVPGALEAIEKAAALQPKFAALQWRRGMWLLDTGDLDEAEAAFRQATAIDEGDPVGWIGLARTEAERGNYKDVIDIIESRFSGMTGLPNGDYVQNLLATAFQNTGNTERADQLRVDSPRRSLTWTDPWAEALLDMRRKSEWMINRANLMIRAGEPRQALAYLLPLEASHPDDPTLLKMQSMAYFVLEDFQNVVVRMEKVISENPDDDSASRNLAYAYERMGLPARAIPLLERIHVKDPTDITSTLNMGRNLVAAKQFEKAFEVYQATVDAHPQEPALHLAMASAYITWGKKFKAREAIDKAKQQGSRLANMTALLEELERAVDNMMSESR